MLSKQDQLIQYLFQSQQEFLQRMDRLEQLLINGQGPRVKKIPKRKKVNHELEDMAEREVNKFITSLNQRYR